MIIRILSLMSLLSLSSCAVGSAASAYSLMSVQADSLTASGEKELVDRVKAEVKQDNIFIVHIQAVEDELKDDNEDIFEE